MLDYKLLQALATVVECGGFERAGEHSLAVPLYWHFWRHSGEVLERLTGVLGEVRLE
ncbi:MAG: hypothetical protein RI841_10135 [Halomonas sp.]|uniref:hypothetical protein n=1 Tax=Halomonas sp. TaxID=1486246 RepID=UPI00286FD64B|nr:hypothetical protein [Halomonas sp.]MDR9439840.1 hypothetical protein [Halomonas sp.]